MAPREVTIEAVDIPGPAADQVVVSTLWSGISSGTEMLAYRGEIDPSLVLDETIGALGDSFTYPFRYGYSCVGRVVGTGPVEDGRLVFAFQPHQDLFVAGAGDLVLLPDVDPRLGTLFPLVETAFQVCLDAGPVLEETVVVVGLGAVGLLVGLMLQRAGAAVVASEPKAWRREMAAALGLESVPPEDLGATVAARTGGVGVPLVIEASGEPSALAPTLDLLAQEGEVLVVSWYGSKPVTLPLGGSFHRRRLRIRSSQVSTLAAAQTARWTIPRRRAVAARLLTELPLGALATHAYPFSEAAAAFAALDRGESGLVHAALCYD